jgi:hypothetical protein
LTVYEPAGILVTAVPLGNLRSMVALSSTRAIKTFPPDETWLAIVSVSVALPVPPAFVAERPIE